MNQPTTQSTTETTPDTGTATTVECPEGYRLAYTVTHEAWYSQPPLSRPPGDRNVLSVSMDNLGGGCAWEFAIDDEIGGGLRVKVYDDGWQAFADVPDFFTALAALGRGALLDEVIEVLNALGFTDATKRVPDDPAIAEALRAVQSDAAMAGLDPAPQVPQACEAWGCDGNGWSHQGTSYKSGEPEKQFAPCGRRCERPEPESDA